MLRESRVQKDLDCNDFLITFGHTTATRIHANSRLLHHYPKGTDLHNSIEGEVERDIEDFVEVDAATHERCRRNFFTANELKMKVCGACGSRGPRMEYDVKELTTVGPNHWVRVPKDPLQRLKDKPPIQLLHVPAKAAGAQANMEDDDNDEQPVEIEVRRHEFHNFWEHDGEAYHVVPEAVFVKEESTIHSICVCDYCAKHWDNHAAVPRSVDASGNGKIDTFDDLYYEANKKGAPVSAIAAGADYGRQAWLQERGIELPGMLEKLVLAKARMHSQKNEKEKAKAKKRKAPPPRGASRSNASVPGGAFDELAMELQLHGQWADVKELMRKGFGPERDRPLPGYSPDQFNLTHQDLSTLWPGTQLRDEAINEMGRRLVTSADSMVFYNTFALERIYPLNLRANEIPVARPLTRKWFSKMAGGFGRKLGIDVKVLVAAQYVPGHYCLAIVDFDRQNFMYVDSFYDFDKDGKHREMGLKAMNKLREHVHEELMRQKSNVDVRSWEILGLKTPRQPDSVSCGVCVLMIIELIAIKGVRALYDLHKQCEELRASAPQTQCRTVVIQDTAEVSVQWTERYINTKRIEYACRLVDREETTGFDLVRANDHEATMEIHD